MLNEHTYLYAVRYLISSKKLGITSPFIERLTIIQTYFPRSPLNSRLLLKNLNYEGPAHIEPPHSVCQRLTVLRGWLTYPGPG